ncbi:MAG: hypothetical protein EZS28_029690, partial [Streblomastix strix]
MQNFNLDSTKQRFIAIYSMMIKTFALPQFRVGSSIKELIDFHLQGHKNYSPLQRIREHSREHMTKEHMMNESEDESSNESENEPVSVPEFNVLICSSENETHAFYIQNKETLTGLRFCPFCKSRAFNPQDVNFARDYEKHIKKCEINEGKIIKEVKLEAVPLPFVPHIMQNKTYAYLLANNRENEFKPTQYYITYDFETVEKVINKDFGKSSKQISQLVPLSVASTIKNKQ